MITNMTGFSFFQNIFAFLCLEEITSASDRLKLLKIRNNFFFGLCVTEEQLDGNIFVV